jgi:putative hemolysin
MVGGERLMGSAGLEIGILFVLILANGLFAMAEIAVVSSRKARLEQRVKQGRRGAQVALDLAQNPGDFLSTVQVGITLIGTLAGAFGGVTLAGHLNYYLSQYPLLDPYSESISFGLVVIAISYLTLILGELAPKNIALINPEGIASGLAPFMKRLASATSVVVRFLSWSSNMVLKLIPLRAGTEPPVTEEEIKGLIEQGTRQGTFEEAEQEMVSAVFRLGDRRVTELMRSRNRVIWLDLKETTEVTLSKILNSPYLRYPVGEGSLDQLAGIIDVKDVLGQSLAGQPLDLRPLLKKPLLVSESKRAFDVIDLFISSGTGMALVIDEHGGVEGLITMTDLTRAIVGEVAATADEIAGPRALPREDGSWLVDGILPVSDLRQELLLPELPGEQDGDFATAAGFVLTQLGRVPVSGDAFEWNGWRFEVVDMDGNRIDKLLISRLPEPPPPEEGNGNAT